MKVDRRVKLARSSQVELMAPVGSFESMMAAIHAGADSIFFGIAQLNMRAKSAHNFSFADLEKITHTCQQHGVKTYLTVNTILYDHDLKLAYKIIDEAKRVGITAVIASDMAAILYANQIEQPVHISTQLSVSNIETVKFYAQYSEMIVLARELTLPMVAKICQQIKEQDIHGRGGELLKIEVFGHGALCIAVSGRCHMSLLTDNSSANRGACTQNCRREYIVTEADTGKQLKLENNYVMSPTDLCTIGSLDELVAAGISTLKIEGRGRSAHYVDTVIRCYREALEAIAQGTYTPDKIDVWNQRLDTVYNRGLSGSFYMGKPFIEWSGAHGNQATVKREYVGVVSNYFVKAKVAEVKVLNATLSSHDEYIFTGETTGLVKSEVGDDKTTDDQRPEFWLDEQKVTTVRRGDTFTVKLSQRVRKGDRVYKLIKNNINNKEV